MVLPRFYPLNQETRFGKYFTLRCEHYLPGPSTTEAVYEENRDAMREASAALSADHKETMEAMSEKHDGVVAGCCKFKPFCFLLFFIKAMIRSYAEFPISRSPIYKLD